MEETREKANVLVTATGAGRKAIRWLNVGPCWLRKQEARRIKESQEKTKAKVKRKKKERATGKKAAKISLREKTSRQATKGRPGHLGGLAMELEGLAA